MREAMLMVHFLGLALGLGTSFAFMFLGRAAAKLEAADRIKFQLNSFAVSAMGQIGLVLLVLSGAYLMTANGGNRWSTLMDTPLLLVKLILVLVLAALIGIISSWAKKAAKSDDPESILMKIRPLGMLSLLCGLAILVLAVLQFK
jgi:uncharacterized membrane protein